MSTTIDQRVVEMQFDNKQFEANVKTSMSTLDKLKQSLNLTGASKGLENVSAAAKKLRYVRT
jgi:aerobic-type carbon monoxide dehydrogenase small subunit (CoxS/CutS family)